MPEPYIITEEIKKFKCLRCGHVWIPPYGVEKPPMKCWKCQSTQWKTPPGVKEKKDG